MTKFVLLILMCCMHAYGIDFVAASGAYKHAFFDKPVIVLDAKQMQIVNGALKASELKTVTYDRRASIRLIIPDRELVLKDRDNRELEVGIALRGKGEICYLDISFPEQAKKLQKEGKVIRLYLTIPEQETKLLDLLVKALEKELPPPVPAKKQGNKG